MVGHLVHVDRAAPLALENVPMGRLGPWLDPTAQLTLCGVSVLVLAALGLSAVAHNKNSAANINKTACSRQKVFSISWSLLRYFTAATLLLFIYRSIPIALASFWPTSATTPPQTPLTVPSSTIDRILTLVRSLVQHVGLLKAQVQPTRPPASSTRQASLNLVSTMLKLPLWLTTEQYLVTLLTISMTTSMLWKLVMAATSRRAVIHPTIRLIPHGLLLAAGGVILTITRHFDTRPSRVIFALIELSVDSANAVLALDIVASLPALVLEQNSRLSILATSAALFGLTSTTYTADIRGYKRPMSPILSIIFPTLHQETAFTYVVLLFALLQFVQITTTSLVFLASAVSGLSKHSGFVLPQKRQDESLFGTLLGYQFTQALLMDVMPGDASALVRRPSWRSRIFDLLTNPKSSTRDSALKLASEADVTVLINELKTAQEQLQNKVNGLQAAKVSLVEKLRSARRKARLNESAMLRWKALAECYEQAASMETNDYEEVGMTAVQSTISEPTVMDSKTKELESDVAELVNSEDVEVLRCLLRDTKGDTNQLKVWLEEESAVLAEPEVTLPADIAPILQLRTLSQLCTSARAEFIEVVTRVREQEKARRAQLSDDLYQQKRSSWSLELASLDLKDNEDALREELYKKEDECGKLKAINKDLQEENEWWTSVDALRVDLFRLGRNFLGDRKRGPPTPTSRADPEPPKYHPSHPKNRLRTRSSGPLMLSNHHGSVALGAL